MQNALSLRRLRVAALALCMLGGCSSLSSNDVPLSASQRSLRHGVERYNQTTSVGVVAGAALGAMLGALLGAVLRPDNPVAGAIVGAGGGVLAGGAGGAVAGNYIASRNQRYSSREEAAAARRDAAHSESRYLAAAAFTSEQVVRENEVQIAALRNAYELGQVQEQELRARLRLAESDLEIIRRSIAHSGKVEELMREDGSAYAADSAATSRREMEQSADRLQRAIERARAS